MVKLSLASISSASAKVRDHSDKLRQVKSAKQQVHKPMGCTKRSGCLTDEKAKEIIERALGEQWLINKTVHFNDWANLGREDFGPVVAAFRELCDNVFACNNEGCDSVLRVTLDGAKINGVRCKCGAVNWNLIKK